MKSIILTIIVLATSFISMAQTTQPCIVKQYNQKLTKTPLPGVQVEVRDAGSATSSANGTLTLKFATLTPGDRVMLRSIKKTGFEIFNKTAIEQWNISRNQQLFEIILVRSKFFAQLKSKLTESSTNNYKKKYEEAKAELAKLQKDGKLKEQDYRQHLKDLEDQYDNALKNLNNYIDQFARIDLSEVSAEEQRILNLVEEGEIDEAVKEYEALNISGKLQQARENKKALTKAKSRIEEEEVQQEQIIKDLKEKQKREIATLKLAGGKENYDKVARILKENALADTTDVEAVWAYAGFAFDRYDFKDAERFYLICLNGLKNNIILQNPILQNLGLIYLHQHFYEKAEEYLLKALDDATEKFSLIPDWFQDDLALIQHNLGTVYYDQHDYAKTEEFYLKALENYTQLFNQNPDAYKDNLASIQNSLGALYLNIHDYRKAEEFFLKALEIYTQMFNQNPDAFRPDLTSIQNNLGVLHYKLQDYKKAEEFFLKALENYTQMFNQNPDAFRADMANIHYNLGNLYLELQDSMKVEEFYLKALENYTQMFSQNPDAFRADMAKTQNSLAYLYGELHEQGKMEKYYLQALENYTLLFNQNQDKYRAILWSIQYNLGDLYYDLPNNTKAEEYLLKALENATEMSCQDSDFGLLTAQTQNKLGKLFHKQYDYPKAEKFYLKALENYKKLFEKQPKEYHRKMLASTQYLLMFIYADDNDRLYQYDDILDKVLANYEILYQSDNNYLSKIVELRKRKGLRYLQKGNTDEAMSMFENIYKLAPEESSIHLAITCNEKAYEYASQKDFPNAIEIIDRAICLMPKEANFYDSKGEILLMKGDEQEAVKMWQKVIELEPDFLSKHDGETPLYKQLKERGLIE